MQPSINQTNCQGKRHGYWETKSNEGTVVEKCYYDNGLLNGPISGYYPNGLQWYEGYFRNDKENGYWKYYWPSYLTNGAQVLQFQGNYIDEKEVGLWEEYHPTGEIKKLEFHAN